MTVIVNSVNKTIKIDTQIFDCRLGRRGSIEELKGREGDEKTPLGHYFFRFGFYRADRLPSRPPSRLNFRSILADDGWCDDENHPAYNRFIRLPFSGSHEALWREDGAYDIVLVISHNDAPPIKGLGSAIFVHIAQADDRQTLGCIAVSPDVMIKLAKFVEAGTPIIIE